MGISRDTNDDGLRWYVDATGPVDKINTDKFYMSVTTVLGFLEEDTTGLERWKATNDGEGDSPHHEHIYWYSAPRGTLCHYQALVKFEDAFDEDDDMWGEEEGESMAQVVEGPAEPMPCVEHETHHPQCESCFDGEFDDASHDLEDVTYSILKKQDIVSSREEYEHLFEGNTRLVDVLHDDVEYFTDAFETVCRELGVDDEAVIRVEKFMVNDDEGYGGQCDLVYEDPGGNVVVADLKTSSSLRQKHRLQSVAYMKAVEQANWGPDTVDRVEVWRIQPDTREWQVHSHEVPEHAEHLYDGTEAASSSYTDAYWFEDKWGDFSYESIEDMWETFRSLATEAHENGTRT